MATTTSITSTYSGEFAGKYISAALLSAPTLENGGITIMPNVKYKAVLQKVATDGIVKDATCDFTDTSTVTLTERIITPEDFQVNLELCKKDWIPAWQSVEMGYSAFDELPKSFGDFLIAHVASKVAQKTEQNIWNGTNASAGEFDGFLTTLAADGDVVDVTGTTVTSANVIGQLGSVVDAIPNAIYGADDLSIFVSQNVARAYVRALGGFGASGLGANGTDGKGTQWFAGRGVGNIGLNYDGVNIFVTNGLPSNKMVAAQASNLFFGTGLMNDYNEVKLIDMADLDGSQNVRVVMRFSAGIQHGLGAEIVLYS